MFLINKKYCVYREKVSSDSENLIALILINNFLTQKTSKKKNQKDQNVSEWNHCWKTGTIKSAWVNIVLKPLFTDKCRHYFWMTATWCTGFHTVITFTYTYWFLQFTTVHVFHFYKPLLLYYATKAIKLLTLEGVSFELVFHWTQFLAFESQKSLSLLLS